MNDEQKRELADAMAGEEACCKRVNEISAFEVLECAMKLIRRVGDCLASDAEIAIFPAVLTTVLNAYDGGEQYYVR